MRRAFTLIELMVVVVIIGILAAIAIPKFSNSKRQGYVAAMKADLRNLASSQEIFKADSSYYMDATSPNTKYWQASTGVNIDAAAASALGWSAKVTRPGTIVTCTMWVAEKGVGAGSEGEPTCTDG
jgi:prepilin-type N-terminal cleavage/methylation domain-containing protein